ncbi:MAG: carbamoyltransferase HypF [Leptospirales bacterium]|nr:carbamoyltransferase HypF [Leptospirales bacterium]
MNKDLKRIEIKVKGIVQGVGFRPAMSKQAVAMGLTGKICNTRDSVHIEIQGHELVVQQYIDNFYNFIPANAVVSSFSYNSLPIELSDNEFTIVESTDSGPTRFSIPPDLAICPLCRKEFYDPGNRRYLYSFISCGDCGPRYTYMKDMPYDRSNTSMTEFPLCKKCLDEYNDPLDRRYHIEGFSCPECGPVITQFDETISLLLKGGIAAIKGLGGYHIACSAIDYNAVQRLRDRKRRPGKPFAIMFKSIESAKEYVNLYPNEEKLLLSKESPIVIVEKRDNTDIAINVAPDNGYLGIMIPYTPLHQLILDRVNIPLIMTSANISGDPLIIDDAKAAKELSNIADIFLIHNREIYKRADDSISYIYNGDEINIRMGRGKMPYPIKLPIVSEKKILSVGGELKSNISIVSDDNLVTSNHIGDLGAPDTFNHFTETVNEMLNFYSVKPDAVIADMHPDYESTYFAKDYCNEKNIKLYQVQHHFAHFLSCYFENELKGIAAGIIFDGTGYGTDGTIWGGEILVGDINSFTRHGRLSIFHLPGGEKAIIEPWRILAGLLSEDQFFDVCSWVDKSILENIQKIAYNEKFSPLASSAGRLFDAAGALLGFKKNVSYEAEAAIYLEMLAMKSDSEDIIPYTIKQENQLTELDTSMLIKELYKRKKDGLEPHHLSKIFHNSLSYGIVNIAAKICSQNNIDKILLSGGVFQNRIMLKEVEKRLESIGLKVFINKRIPTNDAGISAGQAIYGVYNA